MNRKKKSTISNTFLLHPITEDGLIGILEVIKNKNAGLHVSTEIDIISLQPIPLSRMLSVLVLPLTKEYHNECHHAV